MGVGAPHQRIEPGRKRARAGLSVLAALPPDRLASEEEEPVSDRPHPIGDPPDDYPVDEPDDDDDDDQRETGGRPSRASSRPSPALRKAAWMISPNLGGISSNLRRSSASRTSVVTGRTTQAVS